jgi:hypothetical protein
LIEYAEIHANKKLPVHPAYLQARRIMMTSTQALDEMKEPNFSLPDVTGEINGQAKSEEPTKVSGASSKRKGSPPPPEPKPKSASQSAPLPKMRMAKTW